MRTVRQYLKTTLFVPFKIIVPGADQLTCHSFTGHLYIRYGSVVRGTEVGVRYGRVVLLPSAMGYGRRCKARKVIRGMQYAAGGQLTKWNTMYIKLKALSRLLLCFTLGEVVQV